jgi:hypothetical protein
MKAFDATSLIEAGPDTIWAILIDAPGYSAWDSGVERVEGRIAPGEKIRVGQPWPRLSGHGHRVHARSENDLDRRNAAGVVQGRAHLHAGAAGKRRDEVHDA